MAFRLWLGLVALSCGLRPIDSDEDLQDTRRFRDHVIKTASNAMPRFVAGTWNHAQSLLQREVTFADTVIGLKAKLGGPNETADDMVKTIETKIEGEEQSVLLPGNCLAALLPTEQCKEYFGGVEGTHIYAIQCNTWFGYPHPDKVVDPPETCQGLDFGGTIGKNYDHMCCASEANLCCKMTAFGWIVIILAITSPCICCSCCCCLCFFAGRGTTGKPKERQAESDGEKSEVESEVAFDNTRDE
eukprot:TRINITY_DN6813_c0_g1_i1.p1 TRINITY_DN6813_c0_g1~~TRINITY_DN6813_c0_g1_i1.p1  ORF type:complete len:244 (+),score=14.40 TRINITY_DN6813_c0_g1_i1:69-800(+)